MARPTARQRGYGTAWERARADHLRLHPWCAHCEREGGRARAVHVHHSVRHKGDPDIFWNRRLWVSLCEEHHNRDAQQVETRGYANRVGRDGVPTDARHPFFRGEGEQPSEANARPEPSLSRGEASQTPRGVQSRRPKGAGPLGSLSAELVPPEAIF